MVNPKVIILGGGIAGLSAAHELIERGFDVEVYELLPIPGGKARSFPVPGSGKDGRKDLPGEHGFRFFPRFYRHIIDTMAPDSVRAERHRRGQPRRHHALPVDPLRTARRSI